ncbi:MAG: phage late control D family protein [Kofleriaceae bacterium]
MGSAAAPNVDIMLGGDELPDDHFLSYVVDRDMNQPDMATVVLTNQNDIYSKTKIGAPLEIKVGKSSSDKTSIYKGEVVALEPIYKGGEKTRILIRAMNKLHRLLRKRKSVTFAEQSDQQILSKLASDSGLNLEWKHDKSITYKHVYQHNQTDLEFLRTRAARLGCHVWCVDSQVFVKQPDLSASSGISLSVDDAEAEVQLRSFTPRLSSAAIVKKVTVRGWNPETKELITGEASAQSSPLGSSNAASASGPFGNEETFTVDHPIWSKEEADALAKARLSDLSLSYITGEVEVSGSPKFELGKTIEITANAADKTDPFNGRYYVVGVSHRHSSSSSRNGEYVTTLKLARDAQSGTGAAAAAAPPAPARSQPVVAVPVAAAPPAPPPAPTVTGAGAANGNAATPAAGAATATVTAGASTTSTTSIAASATASSGSSMSASVSKAKGVSVASGATAVSGGLGGGSIASGGTSIVGGAGGGALSTSDLSMEGSAAGGKLSAAGAAIDGGPGGGNLAAAGVGVGGGIAGGHLDAEGLAASGGAGGGKLAADDLAMGGSAAGGTLSAGGVELGGGPGGGSMTAGDVSMSGGPDGGSISAGGVDVGGGPGGGNVKAGGVDVGGGEAEAHVSVEDPGENS